MHRTNSVLLSIIDLMRMHMDQPSSKYTDDTLLRLYVSPNISNVFQRLTMTSQKKVLLVHSFSVEEGTSDYQLPPNIGEIQMLGQFDETGNLIREVKPQGEWHPQGPGWRIQENVLSFRPAPWRSSTTEWRIQYVPFGSYTPCYGQGTVSEDGMSFTVTEEILGERDYRVNGWGGCVLRVLGTTNRRVVEERLIDSWDPETAVATLRIPFDRWLPSSGSEEADIVYFEVGPMGTMSMAAAVAAEACLSWAPALDVSQKKFQFLVVERQKTMKTLYDLFSHMNMRKPHTWDRNTIDHPGRREEGFFIFG